MALWKVPPKVKLYEALGCIADGRLRFPDETNGKGDGDGDGAAATVEGRCTSSSGDKDYIVRIDLGSRKVFASDNGSMFQQYMGYPAIAAILELAPMAFFATPAKEKEGGDGAVVVDAALRGRYMAALPLLKGVPWKAVAKKYKNDWDKVIEDVLSHHVPAAAGEVGGGTEAGTARRTVETAVDALQRVLEAQVVPQWTKFGGGAKPTKVSGAKRAR